MNIYLAGLAATILLLAAPASAQPPPPGWIGAFPRPSILCDTSDQVHSILNAFEQDLETGAAKFTELYRTINSRREPTCAVTAVRIGIVAASEAVGPVSIAGNKFYGWIVHIGNGVGDGYYLHLEPRAVALKNWI